MTAKRFVDYFDKDHNYIIQDLQNEDEYQVGFVNCDEDVFLEIINQLSDENEQLKQLLDYADDLIQSHLSEHYIRQWRNFKTGHKEYNDFWEEKLKKHKELKEDLE